MAAGQQNQTDQTANFFWMLVMFIGAGMLVWWFEKTHIISFVFILRGIEMDLIIWFADGYTYMAKLLHLPVPYTHHSLEWWRDFIASHPDHTHLTFLSVQELSEDVGSWLRFPIAIILFVMGCIVSMRHSTARFVKTYSMKSLAAIESQNWPHITPVLGLNLAKQDIDVGPWAMAYTPQGYGTTFNMIEVINEDGKKVWSVRKAEATRQFILQVGPLWSGVDKLPIYLQALVVIFMGRATKKRDVADKYIAQIAASAASGKLNFTGVKEDLAQFKDSKLLSWLEHHHAYTTTLMASMLVAARSDGVLATSEFIWLKAVDRRIWYMLNSAGRQTAVVEISGAFSHWLAEKKLKRSIKTPMVKMAVKGFEEAMAAVLYVEKGATWHSSEG